MGEKCKRLPNGDCHYDQCPADHVHSLRPITKCCLGLAEPDPLPSSDKPSNAELVKGRIAYEAVCGEVVSKLADWDGLADHQKRYWASAAAQIIERLAASRLSVPREGGMVAD